MLLKHGQKTSENIEIGHFFQSRAFFHPSSNLQTSCLSAFNDLNKAIIHSYVHQFADDANLLYCNKSLKKINKHVNHDVKHLSKWYLGAYLNNSDTWESHFKNLIPKLNRAIGLLSKVRHYTPKFLLKTIYHSLFNSRLFYVSQIWGQIKKRCSRRW